MKRGYQIFFKIQQKNSFNRGIEYVRTKTSETTAMNFLQIFLANAYTIKNTYKVGARIGLVFIHLQNRKNIFTPSFICDIASISCSIAALGCQLLGNYGPIIDLSLIADLITIYGYILYKGFNRPKVLEILL